jgi:hypothetical protein
MIKFLDFKIRVLCKHDQNSVRWGRCLMSMTALKCLLLSCCIRSVARGYKESVRVTRRHFGILAVSQYFSILPAVHRNLFFGNLVARHTLTTMANLAEGKRAAAYLAVDEVIRVIKSKQCIFAFYKSFV